MPDDPTDALAALERRIEAAKARAAPPPVPKEDHHEQVHQGWRMVVELVTGLLIGFGIGYGLDVLFGTLPLFLLLFTLLGFAAGVRTMMRTAQEVQDRQAGRRPADEKDDASGD